MSCVRRSQSPACRHSTTACAASPSNAPSPMAPTPSFSTRSRSYAGWPLPFPHPGSTPFDTPECWRPPQPGDRSSSHRCAETAQTPSYLPTTTGECTKPTTQHAAADGPPGSSCSSEASTSTYSARAATVHSSSRRFSTAMHSCALRAHGRRPHAATPEPRAGPTPAQALRANLRPHMGHVARPRTAMSAQPAASASLKPILAPAA